MIGNKMAAMLIVIILLSSCGFVFASDISRSKKDNLHLKLEKDILYVGGTGEDNYTKISDAITDSNNEDTIFVYNGTYQENLVIDKPINLIGMNKESVIIDGQGITNTITINADRVKISNFTIINATSPEMEEIFRAGIRITGSNNTIQKNIIKDNNIGVFIRRGSNELIKDNIFYNSSIVFSPYDIDETNIPLKKTFFNHTIKNNTVNGKSIVYLKNKKDMIISKDTGQLLTFNCSNLTVENISFSRCDFSLIMTYTNNCRINNSEFVNDADIWLIDCDNNILTNNLMTENFHGITLDYSSNNNILRYNNFSNNQLMGIMLETNSNYNIIENNNLINNKKGAYLLKSFKNKWNNNYWDKWIGIKFQGMDWFPQIITGTRFTTSFFIPTIINFDWNPATQPY